MRARVCEYVANIHTSIFKPTHIRSYKMYGSTRTYSLCSFLSHQHLQAAILFSDSLFWLKTKNILLCALILLTTLLLYRKYKSFINVRVLLRVFTGAGCRHHSLVMHARNKTYFTKHARQDNKFFRERESASICVRGYKITGIFF